MTLEAVIEAYASYEKRALHLYRKLAERFSDNPEASQQWRRMSDAEASHFTHLQLAPDWIAMAAGPKTNPDLKLAALDPLAAQLRQLEETAERPALSLKEAAELTLAWEELELPRILDLLSHLPEPAREKVRAGLVGEAERHYADLLELVKAAGAGGLEQRVDALRTRAATA